MIARLVLIVLGLAAPLVPAVATAQQQVDPRVAQGAQQAVALRLGSLELENAQLRAMLDAAQQDAKTAHDELEKSKNGDKPPPGK